MKKYRVFGVVTGGKFLGEFEAESPEEAIEMGLDSDAASVSICHHCSREIDSPQIDSATAEESDEKSPTE